MGSSSREDHVAAPDRPRAALPASFATVQQLSLFERLEAVFPRRADTGSPPARGARPVAPVASLTPALGSAVPTAASVATEPKAPGWPTHHVSLGETQVAYRLRRARRRSIGFVIGQEGLTVSAPRWVGLGDIERALQTKGPWILRKLVEQRERAQHAAAARIAWADGVCLPYLGQPLRVVLSPHTAGVVLEPLKDAGTEPEDGVGPGRVLRVGLPLNASPAQIRERVQTWVQRQARVLFLARCEHFAGPLGVRMSRLRLSSAQTRWGSASADGSIRLNWRLMHFSPATIDYVVAHELAHLREMNHSPAFWAVVRSVVPDLEWHKAQLKAPGLPLWD
jgi:predicted metal-dependent hydrolase